MGRLSCSLSRRQRASPIEFQFSSHLCSQTLFNGFKKAFEVRGRFAEFKSSWNRSLSGAPTSAGEVHVVPLSLPPSGLRVGICVNDRRCGFGFNGSKCRSVLGLHHGKPKGLSFRSENECANESKSE